MATKKKQATSKRKSISNGRPRSYGEIYKNDTMRQQPTVTPSARTAPAPVATESIDWRTEYDYVLRDLRTLLIVSALLFAVIVVAGFFI